MIDLFVQSFEKEPYDAINAVAQIALALTALFALIYAARQYGLTRRRYIEETRPYITIELERIASGLMDLVIRNSGNSAAKNINVEFSPNIAIYDHSSIKINSHKFLKNLKFLAPGKSLSFFFGSVIGGQTKICRKFTVRMTYEDVEGNNFHNDQIIDPRDYLELIYINRKDIHDVAKVLEEIKNETKKSNTINEKLNHSFETGITRKDATYTALDFETLCVVLKNLLTIGIEDVYNSYPMERDAKLIAKIARNKLLERQALSDKQKDVLKLLNKFEGRDFVWKTQEVIDEVKTLL